MTSSSNKTVLICLLLLHSCLTTACVEEEPSFLDKLVPDNIVKVFGLSTYYKIDCFQVKLNLVGKEVFKIYFHTYFNNFDSQYELSKDELKELRQKHSLNYSCLVRVIKPDNSFSADKFLALSELIEKEVKIHSKVQSDINFGYFTPKLIECYKYSDETSEYPSYYINQEDGVDSLNLFNKITIEEELDPFQTIDLNPEEVGSQFMNFNRIQKAIIFYKLVTALDHFHSVVYSTTDALNEELYPDDLQKEFYNLNHNSISLNNILIKSGQDDVNISDMKLKRTLSYKNTNPFSLRLTNFGMCSLDSNGVEGGNPVFMSPHVLNTGKGSFQSDIWALGLNFLILFAGGNIEAVLHPLTRCREAGEYDEECYQIYQQKIDFIIECIFNSNRTKFDLGVGRFLSSELERLEELDKLMEVREYITSKLRDKSINHNQDMRSFFLSEINTLKDKGTDDIVVAYLEKQFSQFEANKIPKSFLDLVKTNIISKDSCNAQTEAEASRICPHSLDKQSMLFMDSPKLELMVIRKMMIDESFEPNKQITLRELQNVFENIIRHEIYKRSVVLSRKPFKFNSEYEKYLYNKRELGNSMGINGCLDEFNNYNDQLPKAYALKRKWVNFIYSHIMPICWSKSKDNKIMLSSYSPVVDCSAETFNLFIESLKSNFMNTMLNPSIEVIKKTVIQEAKNHFKITLSPHSNQEVNFINRSKSYKKPEKVRWNEIYQSFYAALVSINELEFQIKHCANNYQFTKMNVNDTLFTRIKLFDEQVLEDNEFMLEGNEQLINKGLKQIIQTNSSTISSLIKII